MKTTMEYIKNRLKEENKEVWEIALEDEMELTKKSKEEVFALLQKSLDVMKDSSQKALDKKLMSMTKMTGGNAKSMNNYFLSEDT
ncbi:MAG: L-serine ammonia-lyase, iron-sulfur-dependent, subunit alpha, partial [Anaerococcus obesiensis]